ncbi:hypothetical protein CYLTODRAFT_462162 [Cylindrobasidium torrendii FP15055 ss-10]|uniref:C2H2-type domain-containing protein n=1 Tax=Cylindrobasidium torrendii FP15055 ss-10 TaxID=1314674 RepID=A0A0D7BA00_9AGAR|nr:hypothetical protein CYLTODRAFT_462162 [Cylindrobasidium torrendii FP15055 ss-10]
MVNSPSKTSKPYKITRDENRPYPHVCEFPGCRKAFLTKKALSVHADSHDPSSKLKNKCEVPGCSFTCSQAANLKAHMQSKHDNRKPYRCRYCDHNTSTASAMWHHWDRHHSKDSHPWFGRELKATSSPITSGSGAVLGPTDVDAEYSDDEEYLSSQPHAASNAAASSSGTQHASENPPVKVKEEESKSPFVKQEPESEDLLVKQEPQSPPAEVKIEVKNEEL